MDQYDIPQPVPHPVPPYPVPPYPVPPYPVPPYPVPPQAAVGPEPPIHRTDPRSSRRHAPASRSRATLGAFLTTIGCLAGSLAVVAFLISTIAINPERPGEIVKAALSTSAGRSVATDAVAATLRTADPTLSPAQASVDATAIVASPALASSLGTSKIDVSTALLKQLKQVDPKAAAAISSHLPTGANPTSPLSALPTGITTAAGRAHSFLNAAELLLLLIALVAVGAALLIDPHRDRVLVRVGYWALGASLLQLLIWLALPKALGHFSNSWAQIGAAALRAGGTGLLGVFVTLAVVGVVAVGLGWTARMAHRFAN